MIKVICDLKGNELSVAAFPEDLEVKKYKFAFYLIKDNIRIKMVWYSDLNYFSYNLLEPGFYFVICFIKNESGKISTAKSKYLFHNPQLLNYKKSISLLSHNCSAYLINDEDSTIPMLYKDGDNKCIFVLMPSAVNRDTSSHPSFTRWKSATDGIFPGKVICVADPALGLYPKLGLTWFIGKGESSPVNSLITFVKKVADENNIPNEKVFFWGSSAGGFSALACAAQLRGSTAIAINAQTNALKYNVKNALSHVRDFLFLGHSDQAITTSNEKSKVDLSEVCINNESSFILVQNTLDVHHYKEHLLPFWKKIGGDDVSLGWNYLGNIASYIYEDPDGRTHIGESKEVHEEIINYLREKNKI